MRCIFFPNVTWSEVARNHTKHFNEHHPLETENVVFVVFVTVSLPFQSSFEWPFLSRIFKFMHVLHGWYSIAKFYRTKCISKFLHKAAGYLIHLPIVLYVNIWHQDLTYHALSFCVQIYKSVGTFHTVAVLGSSDVNLSLGVWICKIVQVTSVSLPWTTSQQTCYVF